MNELIEKYRDKGLKMTPQRIAIISYLEDNKTHPTADDIYKRVKEEYPTISFATVYNTVQALCNIGTLMELSIDSERKHYDPVKEPHHHIICTQCGKIEDVTFDSKNGVTELTDLPEGVLGGFNVDQVHINLYGVCADCSSGAKAVDSSSNNSN